MANDGKELGVCVCVCLCEWDSVLTKRLEKSSEIQALFVF